MLFLFVVADRGRQPRDDLGASRMLRWLHSAAAKQHPHQLQQPAGAGPKGSKASKGSKGLKGSKGSSSPPTGGTLVSSDPLATLSFSDPRHIYAVSR